MLTNHEYQYYYCLYPHAERGERQEDLRRGGHGQVVTSLCAEGRPVQPDGQGWQNRKGGRRVDMGSEAVAHTPSAPSHRSKARGRRAARILCGTKLTLSPLPDWYKIQTARKTHRLAILNHRNCIV